jgi:shikimate kinase
LFLEIEKVEMMAMPLSLRSEQHQRIILVGLMGCGKSTVGRLLAQRLNRRFFDSDAEIVRATGVEISTIFEVEGEKAFRARETSAIRSLLEEGSDVVLATGGGAVVLSENRALLRSAGVVVYIHAHPRALWRRLSSARGRPLLAGDPLNRLETLYVARDAWYRETAHRTVHVEGEQPGAVATAIQRMLHLEDS